MTNIVLIPRNTITDPQVKAALTAYHSTLVSSFQSVQTALNSVSTTSSSSSTAQELFNLTQQLAALAAQIQAIQKEIDNLPSGGSTASFPVVGTYKMVGAFPSFPVAVYEVSAGSVSAASQTTASTAIPIIGIATATAPGGNCLVTTFGDVDSSTWSWTPDSLVFLGTGGRMTQTQPSSGYICPIGFAVSATRIFIVIGESIHITSVPTSSALTLSGGVLQLSPITGGGGAPGQYILMDGDSEDNGIRIPGNPGATGQQGLQGLPGPAIYLDPEQGEQGMPIPGFQGSNGAPGASGAAGPIIFMEPDQGEEGMPIPGTPGIAGATGIGLPGQYILLQDVKASGTDGGTIGTSGVWFTRNLNTVVNDDTNSVVVASNQFTLQPGTYRIKAVIPGVQPGRFQSRLYNVTSSVVLLGGSSSYMSNGGAYGQAESTIEGEFTLISATTFAIQMWSQVTSTQTYALGASTTTGANEIYTIVELLRISNQTVGSGLQVLAQASVRTGTDQTAYSITSTSPTNPIDATNLSVTFTSPPSGEVLVSFEGVTSLSAGGVNMFWTLISSGSALFTNVINTQQNPLRLKNDFYITGLTPGASYTYQWGCHVTSGVTASVYSGPTFGSLDMLVVAVNTATPPSVSKSVVVPVTGFSNTIPSASTASIISYVLNPAGVLATGTLTMPATPFDGQIVAISSTQTITAFTLNANAGQSIKNAASTLTAGPSGSVSYIYDLTSTTWYPA